MPLDEDVHLAEVATALPPGNQCRRLFPKQNHSQRMGRPVLAFHDLLIFSRTLEDHLEHLKMVLERILQFHLKLNTAKCRFFREEVEYLGHIIITADGLKTNPKLVQAVSDFPVPKTI